MTARDSYDPNQYQAIDPTTELAGVVYPLHSAGDAAARLEALARAQTVWRGTSLIDRATPLQHLAVQLRKRAEELAHLMASEMGKPLAQGRGEVEKSAAACEYYALSGADSLARVTAEFNRSTVVSVTPDPSSSFEAGWVHEPLGVILAIMPWNFPVWQVVRAAAPALMAGNAVALKHAPNVPGCAEAIERLFHDAGFGDDGERPPLFTNLRLALSHVPEVIAHPAVQGITLTGSVAAGRAVAAEAGRHLKKTVLELGGSDPALVLSDADLDRAATACVTSRLQNAGQSCIAAKRFIVVDDVHDAFVARLVGRLQSVMVGSPLDSDTSMGPLARRDLRDALHDQVERTVAAGARLRLGGIIPDTPGWWYPPTLLTNVEPGMAAADEELFGPVAAVLHARDEDHAIELANQTPYGLGASVYTRDHERGRRIAERELRAGSCFVNDFVRSDPRLPFGGIKDSGYGRELSPLGIREFVNVKTVVVA